MSSPSGPSWDYIAKLVVIGDSGCGKSSLTVRLCEGRFTNTHDVTIGVEFGSRIVPVGPPASLSLGINDPSNTAKKTSGTGAGISAADQRDALLGVKITTAAPKNKRKGTSSLPEPPRTKSSQKHMKLSLWDTAGQETYKSITRSYFRGASGALLVFDITRRNTFESVTQWLHDLRQIAEEGIVVILVGNKSDLASASLVESGGGSTGSENGGKKEIRDESHDGGSSGANKRAVTQDEAREWCRRNQVMEYVETSAKSGDGVERAFTELAERIFQNIEAGKYDLNDRRSGVKGPGAGGGAARGGGNRAGGEVVLGVNEVGGMNRDGKRGWGGGCC